MNAADFNLKIVRVVDERFNTSSLQTFHQDFHGSICQFEDLENICHRSRLVNICRLRFVIAGIALGCEEDAFLFGHGFFQGQNGLLPSYKQGKYHEREDNDVP